MAVLVGIGHEVEGLRNGLDLDKQRNFGAFRTDYYRYLIGARESLKII